MSQTGIGKVIDKLITDENLRTPICARSHRSDRRAVFARDRAHARRDRIAVPDGCASVVPGGEMEGGRRHDTPFPFQRAAV